MLKAVHAVCQEGRFIFANEKIIPKDGTEVVITFFEDLNESVSRVDAIASLRGRGKGERLVEKLLQSREEDLEHDERNCRRLRS